MQVHLLDPLSLDVWGAGPWYYGTCEPGLDEVSSNLGHTEVFIQDLRKLHVEVVPEGCSKLPARYATGLDDAVLYTSNQHGIAGKSRRELNLAAWRSALQLPY